MNISIKRLVLGFALLTVFPAFQNCSKIQVSDRGQDSSKSVALDTPNDPNSPPQDNCTERLEYTTKPMKLLLIVDTSGSNMPDQYGPGTDIDKVWRLKVINSIVERYGQNPAISFGMITFQDKGVTPQIKSPSGEAIFTNDSTIIQAGIESFKKTPDQLGTPTDKALQFAADMIQKDQANKPEEGTGYSVVFLSDGVPHKDTYNNDPDLVKPDAQLVMDAAPGKVRLNAVFYYVDETYNYNGDLPIRLMKNIASVGQGTYLEANTGKEFTIDNLVQYAVPVCE